MSSSFTRKKIQGYSYGLNDTIGKGYSSQVYKGRHDETNQQVAVKVIDLKMLKNEINKILLQSQIQVLKQLKALPQILSLHEVYTTKNNTYIITELCDSDLNKVIKKGLSESQAISFMQQILIGYLNFARRDIIHRDLKPANILITQDRILKIADFGFAIKTVDAPKSNKYNVGSPLYMAPQSLKRNEYTLKTDIWALGIIFYEMLTGQTPWKAKNEKELIRKIENDRVEDLLVKMNVGAAAKEFLKKTLKVDKHARINIDELAEFNFGHNSNILAEKKLNVELRSINISHNMSLMTPKLDKSLENRLYIDRTGENRKNSREHSQNKFNSFRNESINHSIQLKPNISHKYSAGFQIESTRKESGKENPQTRVPFNQPSVRNSEYRVERKSISKILVSEIHFCRFLYKLLNKISESYKKSLLQHSGSEVESIVKEYTAIIRHKIQNLVKFSTVNFIHANCYEEYKESTDYQKLMKIAKEYKERYSQELKEYWNCQTNKVTFGTNNTSDLIQHLYKLLNLRQGSDSFIESYSKEIVILDYLITAKQLIELFKNGENYEKFAKKSRIQEIVEGKTAEISRQLYSKIMSRAKDLIPLVPPSYGSTFEERMNALVA